MKVMAVDDNEQNLYFLEVLLKSVNYEVMAARDGLEALEHLRKGSFSLIISDILMPRMDGFQLCRECKSDPRLKHIPFIFYTATYTDAKDEEFALKLGADRFVVKPAEPQIFLATIGELIDEYEKGSPLMKESLINNEDLYLVEYNKRLINKLEKKMLDLEATHKSLAESEMKYRSLFDNSIDAVFLTSPEGRILEANPEGSRIFGYTGEELCQIGRNGIMDLSDPRLPEALEERNRTGRFRGELMMVRKDGTKFPGEISSAVFKNRDGAVRTSMIIRDISHRKRDEQEKATLQEQLRQSQKMEAIGQLAGGIAHDFNNLLTVIQGYAQISLLDLQELDPLKTNIEEIRKAGKQAADLTRQLLAFSRKQILEIQVLDVNQVFQRLDKMLRRIIGEDIELMSFLSESLGKIKADPGQMEQVIINLAVNARDAMPNGGKLTIETANVELGEGYAREHVTVEPGRYVMFSVSDNGVGMTPEVRERVFEPFFTTKEKGKGTGLGLSTVYGIVKQSGGNIWVYSERGQGATFKIYLPRVDEPLTELKERVTGEVPRGHETILIVEDEDVVRKLSVRVLRKHGYKVLEAPDGGKALMLCEEFKEPIHLILTDVVMPGMSGRRVAERIKEIHPEMKALFMSGYTDNAILHHGILEPGLNFLQKPFNVEDLARKVREVLDK
jgi:two-component system, cell cycle sensor histidine kinase and response regulator CckA